MATRDKVSVGAKPKGRGEGHDYYLRKRPDQPDDASEVEPLMATRDKVSVGNKPKGRGEGHDYNLRKRPDQPDDDAWECVDDADLEGGKSELTSEDKSLPTPPANRPHTIEQVNGSHTQKSTALSEALREKRLLQDQLDERLMRIEGLEQLNKAQQNEIAQLRLQMAISSGPSSDFSSGAYHTPMISLSENQQTDTNDRVSLLQRDLQAKTKQIEEQCVEIVRKDEKILELQQKFDQQRKAAPQGGVGKKQDDVLMLTQELSARQEENRKLKQEINQLKRRFDHAVGLEEQLTQLTITLSTLEEEKKELQKQLQLGALVGQPEVGAHDHTCQQKLRDEIELLRPLKERSVALEQQLKAAQRYEKEYREAIDKNMKLKAEITSLKAEVQKQVIPRADDMSDPKDEASKLKAQVKAKNQAMSKLQAELKASQEVVKELNRVTEHSKKQSCEIMYLKQELAAALKDLETPLAATPVGSEQGGVGKNQGDVMRLTQELSAHQEENRKLKQEINQLKRQFDHAVGLEEQLTQLTLTVTTLEEEKKELQKQLQLGAPVGQPEVGIHDHTCQQKLRDEIEKLRALKERSVALEQQLKAAQRCEKEYREAIDENLQLKKEIVSLKAEEREQVIPRADDMSDPKDEASKLKALLKTKDQATSKLQAELKASQEVVKELNRVPEHSKKQSREVMYLKQEQAALKAGEEEHSEYEQSLIDSVRNLQDENRKLQDELQGANRDRGSLKETLTAATASKKELVTRVQLLEAQVEGLGLKEESARKQLQSLNDSYRKMQQQHQEMKTENQKLLTQIMKLSTLSEENANLKLKIGDLNDQISLLTQLTNDILDDLEAAKAEVEFFARKKDEQDHELASLRFELEKLRREKEAIAQERTRNADVALHRESSRREAFERKCADLERMNDQLKRESREVTRQLEGLTANRQQLQQRNHDLLTQLQEMRSQRFDFWRILPKDVEVLQGEKNVIGRGAWGYVAKGMFRGQVVAVKCLHQAIHDPRAVERVNREVCTMAQVRHPNLVLFLAAVYEQGSPPMIVTELLDINLRKAYETERLQGSSKLVIFRDIACALNYLHQHREPIIHRDVSAPNVLLEALPNRVWKAKVSDFGSANLARYSKTMGEGAIVYSAPETYPQPPSVQPLPQTTKIDVYSYGVLLCEVIIGEIPEPNQLRIKSQEVRKQWPAMYNLIDSCIQWEATNRPTMARILTGLP